MPKSKNLANNPVDANKYGGTDSWDDYDNTNTMSPEMKRIMAKNPTVRKAMEERQKSIDEEIDAQRHSAFGGAFAPTRMIKK